MTRLSIRILALVCILANLSIAVRGGAHSITVDADASDWSMAAPTTANTGHIGRNAVLQGEYVWKDEAGDEIVAFTSPDERVDLVEVRLTADTENLYVLAWMADIDLASGDGAPQIQVAIDTDLVPGSGQTFLGAFADTSVSNAAAWEFLLITRFGSGNNDLSVWQNGFVTMVTGGAAAISTTTEIIELAIPWTVLEMNGPPAGPFRFTVATLRANVADNSWDNGGPAVSNVLDCVTNYAQPGTSMNTFTEVTDGVVDYHFDVYMDVNGEVVSPLLVGEVFYDATGSEPGEEWVQLWNVWPVAIVLDGWKVGDEEAPFGSEGMEGFPALASLASTRIAVVANQGAAFEAVNICLPGFEFTDTGPTPDMIHYAPWSSGSVGFANTGDEVLLLDSRDTVMDVVTYEAGAYPGVAPHPGVPAGSSIRRGSVVDTNDSSVDFVAISLGLPCESKIPSVVFADDFESGDTLAWSATIGP
jgi:hypothetical protein